MLPRGLIYIAYIWSIVTGVWIPVDGFFVAPSDYPTYPFVYDSGWIFGPPVDRVQKAQDEERQHGAVKVRRITSMGYKGQSYMMVENLTLPFDQAESYCQTEFSEPMHLASIHSDDEWARFTRVFGPFRPSGLWLGGIIQHPKPNFFLLSWLDNTRADYHRFPLIEQKDWISRWRTPGHGCIVANAEESRRGNWSVELAPCSTMPRAFVCKKQKSADFDLPIHVQLRHTHFGSRHSPSNLFKELFRPFLFPPRRRMPPFRPTGRQDTRFRIVGREAGSTADQEMLSQAPSSYWTTRPDAYSDDEEVESPETTSEAHRTPTTSTVRSTIAATTVSAPATTPKIESSTTSSTVPILPHTEAPPTTSKSPTDVETDYVPATTRKESPQHTDETQSHLTRIIHAVPLETQLTAMDTEHSTIGNPKFVVVHETKPGSSSPISVVRMPILQSSAQVIHPESIWDLA